MTTEEPTEEEINRQEILIKEYFYLQGAIDDFDKKIMTIKAWSITASLAGFVTAVSENTFKAEILIISISLISSLCFWVLESRWKFYQMANYKRVDLLEDYFQGKIIEGKLRVADISGSWQVSYKKLNEKFSTKLKVMFSGAVILPHAVIVIIGFVLLILKLTGKL